MAAAGKAWCNILQPGIPWRGTFRSSGGMARQDVYKRQTVINAKNVDSVKKSEVTIKKVTFKVGTTKYSVDVTADAS